MSKRNRSRRVMPEKIPDSPEEIARACMQGPPKKDWDFIEEGSDAYEEVTPGPGTSAS